MKQNKNMLKTHNNRAEMKSVPKKKFYAVVAYKAKEMDLETGEEKTVTKTTVVDTGHPVTRMDATRMLNKAAKKMRGKVTFLGAFGKGQ